MIPDIVPVNNWQGNSYATEFDFDFLINSESELKVLHTDANDYQTTLKLNIDYTINQVGNENGSSINFPILGSKYSVLKENEVITLMLDIPVAQTTPFATSAVLNLKSLEFALDYIVRLIQMMSRKIERSIKVQEGSNSTPDNLIESIEESEHNALVSANNSLASAQNSEDSAALSKLWATLLGSKVNNEDYSSKYYAQQSQSFANVASEQKAIVVNAANDKITEMTAIKNETQSVRDEIEESGLYKYQLFDIVAKDHQLTYAESQGFAQLGTYVYKTAVAGSRYGYETFYDKCIEEYNQVTSTRKYWIGNNIEPRGVEPLPTVNKNILYNFSCNNSCYLIPALQQLSSTYNGYIIQMKCRVTIGSNWEKNPQTIIASYTPYQFIKLERTTDQYLKLYVSGNGTSYNIANGTKSSNIMIANTWYWIRIKYDGANYTVSTSTNGSSYSTEISVASTNLLKADSRYVLGAVATSDGELSNYFGGEFDLDECKMTVDDSDTMWVGTKYYTVKKHSNGHMFYPIADKATIDKIYQMYGVAWFYGIDTANQRVFLPRNDYYFKNRNIENVGEYIEAGLPNISGEFTSMKTWSDMTISAPFYSIERTTSSLGGSGATYYTHRIGLDPSLSNPIYGNSDTVQPPSVGVMYYMVVGNTVTDTSNIDVVTQTQNGVKDIDDAVDDGLARLNSVDALKTTQITNCVVEASQNIKYEIDETGITIKAGTLVIFPYGTEDLSSTYTAGSTFFSSHFTVVKTLMKSNRFYVICKHNSDYKLAKYGVKNVNLLTQFGVDTSTNSRIFILTKPTSCSTGTTDYTDYTERHTHWNTTTNLIKTGNVNVDETNRILALPIFELYVGKATADDGNYIPESVVQDFNVAGYFANAFWQADGIKISCPNGRNADGSLDNIIATKSFNVSFSTHTDSTQPTIMFSKSSGLAPAWYYLPQIYYQNEKPFTPNDTAYGMWYSPQENVWRETKADSQWNIVTYCPIAEFSRSSANTIITSMNTNRPFQAVDYSEFAKKTSVYIKETHLNGTSGYILYSNGLCEQWGKAARSAASDTVTLLKSYKNVDYNLQISPYHTTLNTDGRPPLIYETSKAVDSFVFNLYTSYAGIYWKTSGYVN